MFNIVERSTGFKADFILLRDGEFQQVQFGRRKVKLSDTDACVVSGENLIRSSSFGFSNRKAAGNWMT